MLQKWRTSKRLISEQKRWQARGAVIDTAEQLLRCYYRDITALFIPEFLADHSRSSASHLQQQYRALYGHISHQSWVSSEIRQATNLSFDLGALSRSSIRVWEQLAKDPHCIIDLKEIGEPLREQPTNFVSHVLNVLRRLQMKTVLQDDIAPGSELRLIKQVVPYIIICISGEVLRSQGL